MSETIRTSDLDKNKIVLQRDVYTDNSVNSLDVEQTNGNYVVAYPYASQTQVNNVTIYPPSPMLQINKPVVMTGFSQIGDLNNPTDARYDYVRRKIWIADAGNNRILKINEDTQVVEGLIDGDELQPDQLIHPYAIAVDLNNGGIFARGFTGENADQEAIFWFNSDTTLKSKFILTPPSVDESSSSSSMDSESSLSIESSTSDSSSSSFIPTPVARRSITIVHDHVRSRVWWLQGTQVYMLDEGNQQINIYDLKDNAFSATASLDVELETGNPLIIAQGLFDSVWYVVQMNRDNTQLLAVSYVPKTVPVITGSDSSSSSESDNSYCMDPVCEFLSGNPNICTYFSNWNMVDWRGYSPSGLVVSLSWDGMGDGTYIGLANIFKKGGPYNAHGLVDQLTGITIPGTPVTLTSNTIYATGNTAEWNGVLFNPNGGWVTLSCGGSSSETFPAPDAPEIRVPIISQRHHNMIPITWIGETGTPKDLGDNAQIRFMVESSNSAYMDYTAIINRDNSALTNGSSAVSTTYVPEKEEAKFKHQSVFYVDIITHDESGVKKVRTHVGPDEYEFEDPDNVFIIPRFSWDNTLRGASNAASLGYDGTFWVGSETGKLSKIGYNSNGGSILHSITIGSYLDRVMFASNNNRMYVSTDSNLYLYYVENYVDRDEVDYVYSNVNSERTSMALYDSNVWSVETYFGNVVVLDKDTLGEIKRYTDFDGPFKIVKSQYHQGNIVAGAHILWLVKDDDKTAIYEVNDFRIADFDVSPDGKVCLLLNGDSYDVLRVLDKGMYKFIRNETVQGETLRYCKYIDAGKFFILSEISVTGTKYSTFGHIYDSVENTLEKIDFKESVATTTTTSTSPSTTNAIEILFPNGFEQLVIGYNYEIKWVSTKSLTDLVKIELYKAGVFSGLIEAETKNTGFYQWNVSPFLDPDSDYNIKLTWLSPNAEGTNADFCDNNFSIVASPVATTTTTTTEVIPVPDRAIGIVYDRDTNRVVFALKSGLFGYMDLTSGNQVGAFNLGIPNLSSIAIGNDIIPRVKTQTKARVFVGSQPHLSDRWDSGEIETGLTSIYYGGGNNLVPGEKYYVHIQIYSAQTGWSEVEMKEFVMPK